VVIFDAIEPGKWVGEARETSVLFQRSFSPPSFVGCRVLVMDVGRHKVLVVRYNKVKLDIVCALRG
jgi:hypothetical protein